MTHEKDMMEQYQNAITDMIENPTVGYAMCYAEHNSGSQYGHIYLRIYPARKNGYYMDRYKYYIEASAQIGGAYTTDSVSEGQHLNFYALKWGLSAWSSHEVIPVEDIAFFHKVLSSMQKKLDKMDEEHGYNNSVEVQLQRILLASGVKTVIGYKSDTKETSPYLIRHVLDKRDDRALFCGNDALHYVFDVHGFMTRRFERIYRDKVKAF